MTVFNHNIKRIAKFTENTTLEKELNNIISQLANKEDVLYKNGLDKTHTIAVGDKLTIVNGQITKIESGE